MPSSTQAATEHNGTLLTLNVLRCGSNSNSASVATPDAFQPESILPVIAQSRPALIEVLLQVDEKSILVQQRGKTQSTVAASTQRGQGVPHLLGVSPICFSQQDGAEIKEVLVTGLQLQCPDAYVRARCQGNFLTVSCGPAEEDSGSPGALPGQQCVTARLQGIPTGGALVLVELQLGATLSGWKPLVVVPSSKAAREINILQSSDCVASNDSFVADLGRWLDYVACFSGSGLDAGRGKSAVAEEVAVAADASGAASKTQYYANASEYRLAVMNAAPRDRMLSTGLQLLSTAADRGWPHTCAMLVDSLLAVNVEYDWIVGMIGTRGPSLLLRAVRSKNIEAVHAIYGMGEAHAHVWTWDSSDAHGITPLHVAAVLEDEGKVAFALIRKYASAARLWQTARAFDGLTPADCAAQCGRDFLNATVQRRLKELATPYQSHDKENASQEGGSQRLLANHGLPVEEMQRLVQEATAQARARVAGADAEPEAPTPDAPTGMPAAAKAAADTAGALQPSGSSQLVRSYVFGGFAAPVETRYQAHRTVQTLQQDQVVYPLLVVLLALTVAVSHLMQGGALTALITVLVDLAGQMLSMFILIKFPKMYLRNRQQVWLCTQLIRPVLVMAVACGVLPLPLSWIEPTLVNTVAHAVVLPCLEHFTVPQSVAVRGASAIAELAVVMSRGGANVLADIGHVLVVRACGVCISGVIDFKSRTSFLERTKSD